MKTKIFLTVLLFGLITQKSNAQCTWLTNTYPGSGYLGWNNGYGLNFATNAATQMTLTTNGDLNITGGATGYMIGNNQMLYTGGDSRKR